MNEVTAINLFALRLPKDFVIGSMIRRFKSCTSIEGVSGQVDVSERMTQVTVGA